MQFSSTTHSRRHSPPTTACVSCGNMAAAFAPRAAEDGVGGRRKAPSVHGVPHVGEPAPADRNDCVRALKDAAREPDDRCCVAEQQDSRAQVRRVLGAPQRMTWPDVDAVATATLAQAVTTLVGVWCGGAGGEVQAKGQAGVKCHRPVLKSRNCYERSAPHRN